MEINVASCSCRLTSQTSVYHHFMSMLWLPFNRSSISSADPRKSLTTRLITSCLHRFTVTALGHNCLLKYCDCWLDSSRLQTLKSSWCTIWRRNEPSCVMRYMFAKSFCVRRSVHIAAEGARCHGDLWRRQQCVRTTHNSTSTTGCSQHVPSWTVFCPLIRPYTLQATTRFLCERIRAAV